jgi:hypothetical protein
MYITKNFHQIMAKTHDYSGCFAFVLGFDEKNLQPSLLNRFVTDVMVNWFVLSKKFIVTLRDHSAIGAHTSIYCFEPTGSITKYMWSHLGRQPFGKPTPHQCPECKCIGAWATPTGLTVILIYQCTTVVDNT